MNMTQCFTKKAITSHYFMSQAEPSGLVALAGVAGVTVLVQVKKGVNLFELS